MTVLRRCSKPNCQNAKLLHVANIKILKKQGIGSGLYKKKCPLSTASEAQALTLL